MDKVSAIHDHRWDFESLVLRGRVENRKYNVVKGEVNYVEGRVMCGPNPVHRGARDTRGVCLQFQSRATYTRGDSYQMYSDELHSSHPEDGTITVCMRRSASKGDDALVYWPIGEDWVSAEPRIATPEEVKDILYRAGVL